MNFIFDWSTRYLTSERSKRVRYRVEHEKIKFIAISGYSNILFIILNTSEIPNHFTLIFSMNVSLLNMEEVPVHDFKPLTKIKFIFIVM